MAEIQSRDDVVLTWNALDKAWREGRPIVPLFGAGISAAAGIPLTQPMVKYLKQVAVSNLNRNLSR